MTNATTTIQDEVGRPDGWTGDLLAGVYEIDVEYAVRSFLGVEKWERWRGQYPDDLGIMVGKMRDVLHQGCRARPGGSPWHRRGTGRAGHLGP